MHKLGKLELLKLASLRMPDLLMTLGATNPTKNGSYVQASCPVHKGDNRTALTVYLDTCRWMCFTNCCHGRGSSESFFKLVQLVYDIDEDAAVEWLAEALGVGDRTTEVTTKLMTIDALKRRRRRYNRPLPDHYIASFIPDANVANSYYEQRGYHKATLRYFDVRYCFSRGHRFCNRAIIPVHDTHGNLVGVSGRWMGELEEDDETNKFIHTKGMIRSQLLYNWHRAYKYFDSGYVMLTESPGAVWGLHQIGRFNAVAALGGNLSEDQVKIIASCPKLNTTVLCFDADKAGRTMSHRAAELLHGKTNVQIVELPEGLDLDNIDSGEFLQCFAARKNFIPV